jgi:hypothetical protein
VVAHGWNVDTGRLVCWVLLVRLFFGRGWKVGAGGWGGLTRCWVLREPAPSGGGGLLVAGLACTELLSWYGGWAVAGVGVRPLLENCTVDASIF